MTWLPKPYPPGHLTSKDGHLAPWTSERGGRGVAKANKALKAKRVKVTPPANPWDARK